MSEKEKKTCSIRKDSVLIGLLVSYVGTPFRGLQFQSNQPGCHTVEGILQLALNNIKGLTSLTRSEINVRPTFHFLRACRTDCGVHATRNLVCFQFPKSHLAEFGSLKIFQDQLNASLAKTLLIDHDHDPLSFYSKSPIQVMDVMIMTSFFNPKKYCSRRHYSYLIPAFAVMDSLCDSWESFFTRHTDLGSWLDKQGSDQVSYPSSIKVDLQTPNNVQELLPAAENLFATVQFINKLCTKFLGSNHFHNFCGSSDFRGIWNYKSVKPFHDQAMRTISRCEIAECLLLRNDITLGVTYQWMKSIYCKNPLQRKCDSEGTQVTNTDAHCPWCEHVRKCQNKSRMLPAYLPYFVFHIEGNSFLYHMIRKIIGIVIAVVRENNRESIMNQSLSSNMLVTTPLAPGKYLSLVEPTFSGYDNLVASSPNLKNYLPIRETWSRQEVRESVGIFFECVILPEILNADLSFVSDSKFISSVCDLALTAITDEGGKITMRESLLNKGKFLEWPTKNPPQVELTEMTSFLRSLRVFNWEIRSVPPAMIAKQCDSEKKDIVKRMRSESTERLENDI